MASGLTCLRGETVPLNSVEIVPPATGEELLPGGLLTRQHIWPVLGMTSRESPLAEWEELWARGRGTMCLPQRTGKPKLRLLHQRRGLSASRACWGVGMGGC